MKNFILYLAAAVLFTLSGCKKPETVHIPGVEKAVMGKIYHPRHGEGELFTIDSPVPQGFDRMLLEVVPFEHQLFRIVLEIEAAADSEDALLKSRELVCKSFHIAPEKFTPGDNSFTAELPGTQLTLRRAFHLGPRATALEIIDRKYEEKVGKIKNSDRYRAKQQRQKLKNELRLIAQGIDGYKLDTGKFPENLSQLRANSNHVPNWNGPYYEAASSDIFYRRISDAKYELFANSNGKKIFEDNEL